MKDKEIKRNEAIERQKLHNILNPLEKLWNLDCRLGPSRGAKKKRRRLEALVEITYKSV